MKGDFIFTSESVTEGHPDKLCDGISDAIVDSFLKEDPFSRVSAECAVAKGILFIAARFASKARIDIPAVARQVIAQVGYDGGSFSAKSCSIMTSLNELPAELRVGADERDLSDAEIDAIPAKNQVTIFGFACTQTPGLMPLPIWLSHKLARRLAAVRLRGELSYLAPDGKTQVAVEYRARRPYRIHGLTVIAALEDKSPPTNRKLHDDLMDSVVKPVFEDEEVRLDNATRVFINPGGPLFVGGPAMHSGLSGRKTSVDMYGQYARQSDSALSGKDPTRIDRIGAYAARYAAKNVVMAGLAEECEVQLSYSIGLSHPVSVQVETFGTAKTDDADIVARVGQAFDFRLAAIVGQFNLRHLPSLSKRGFYNRLAAYGHVGRMDMGLPWEVTNRIDALRG